jgi:hypothetical protein
MLKKVILFILIVFGGTITIAQNSSARFKFVEEIHDFGMIKEGDVVTYDYSFTNSGSEPLVISNVTAMCGCTVPTWSRVPIMPGAKGTISISFNSQGKVGMQQKSVYIESNAPTNDPLKTKYELYFKCIVNPKN